MRLEDEDEMNRSNGHILHILIQVFRIVGFRSMTQAIGCIQPLLFLPCSPPLHFSEHILPHRSPVKVGY